MVHLYYGDGKGKTTCAMGLALRCAGWGKRVVIAQFMKASKSGERFGLGKLENVTLMPVPNEMKFVMLMSEEEYKTTEAQMNEQFDTVVEMVRKQECDMLVLDELCLAVDIGMISLEKVMEFLNERHRAEIVITGRKPAQELLDRADYVTEMKKVKHPYDKGRSARTGIEW